MKEYSKEEWIEEFSTLICSRTDISSELGQRVAEREYYDCYPGSTPKEAVEDIIDYWFDE